MSTSFNIDNTLSMEDDDLIFALYRPLHDSQWLDPSTIQISQYDGFSHTFHDGVQMSNDFSAADTTQYLGGHTNNLPYTNQVYAPPDRSIGVAAETLRSHVYSQPPPELPIPPFANPYPRYHPDSMLDPNSGPTPGQQAAQMIPEEETALGQESLGLQATARWAYERDRRLEQLLTGTTIRRDLTLPCFAHWHLRYSAYRGITLGLEPGEFRIMDENGNCTYCGENVKRGIKHFASHILDDIYREHTIGQGRMGILSTPERMAEAFDWFESHFHELRCVPCNKEFLSPSATKVHVKMVHRRELSFGGEGDTFHGTASKLLQSLGFQVRRNVGGDGP